MSVSESRRQPGLRWVAGVAGILATSLILGFGLWGPTRGPSWREIQAAVDSQRWVDAEAGLRRWLREKPEDRDAWMMLGELLFDRGREDEALLALRRVKEGHRDWVHAQTLIGEIAVADG